MKQGKIPKIPVGYKRQWVKCRQCGNVAYYDYVPFSLSNPITTAPCGHGVGWFKETHKGISADEALDFLLT